MVKYLDNIISVKFASNKWLITKQQKTGLTSTGVHAGSTSEVETSCNFKFMPWFNRVITVFFLSKEENYIITIICNLSMDCRVFMF